MTVIGLYANYSILLYNYHNFGDNYGLNNDYQFGSRIYIFPTPPIFVIKIIAGPKTDYSNYPHTHWDYMSCGCQCGCRGGSPLWILGYRSYRGGNMRCITKSDRGQVNPICKRSNRRPISLTLLKLFGYWSNWAYYYQKLKFASLLQNFFWYATSFISVGRGHLQKSNVTKCIETRSLITMCPLRL